MFRSSFFKILLNRLKPDGEILLATNMENYATEALEWGTNIWGLGLKRNFSFQEANKPVGYPRTHFEKKYLERGEICRELHFAKDL